MGGRHYTDDLLMTLTESEELGQQEMDCILQNVYSTRISMKKTKVMECSK